MNAPQDEVEKIKASILRARCDQRPIGPLIEDLIRAAVEAERAAIVAWLFNKADDERKACFAKESQSSWMAAEAIERGEHRGGEG